MHGDLQRLAGVHRRGALQRHAQRLAIDVLGGDEVTAVGLADFVNGQDVGVIEGGRRLGFLFEPPQPVFMPRVFGRQQLERDLAAERRIFGEVTLLPYRQRRAGR